MATKVKNNNVVHFIDKRMFPVVLAAGFFASLFIRILIGGVGVSRSPIAGLVFALLLSVLYVGYGRSRVGWNKKALLLGIFGIVVICLPVLVRVHLFDVNYPEGNFVSWGLVVAVVATAEEAFLRGVLYDAVKKAGNETAAIIVAAVVFALLHVPLYGWHVIPLDFAVGIFLGVLRRESGGWSAPAIAHVGADLASWWI